MQVTLLQPGRKRLPEGGMHTMVGFGSQLSVAVGLYSTLLPFGFEQRIKMLLGQLITGGMVSGRTMTSKQHHWIADAVPGALVQQTVVTPGGKTLPDGFEQKIGTLAPLHVFVP